jgi:hypothetical protein
MNYGMMTKFAGPLLADIKDVIHNTRRRGARRLMREMITNHLVDEECLGPDSGVYLPFIDYTTGTSTWGGTESMPDSSAFRARGRMAEYGYVYCNNCRQGSFNEKGGRRVRCPHCNVGATGHRRSVLSATDPVITMNCLAVETSRHGWQTAATTKHDGYTGTLSLTTHILIPLKELSEGLNYDFLAEWQERRGEPNNVEE